LPARSDSKSKSEAAMGLEISQEEEGAIRILALKGRLDTETAADLELALQDLLGAGERNFLLDLAGIGYVSSAGLRVLLGLAKKLDGGKGNFRLCGLSAAVRQVFDVAGFSKLFAIFPNREAALGDVPRMRPEALLAQKAASLLKVGVVASPNPLALELARTAALLLGAKAAATAGKSAPSLRAPVVPVSAFERQRSAMAAEPKPAGLLAKLRQFFGAKS
jgi:anti-anti-sigma factor